MTNSDYELKMSIEEIRNKINVYKKHWLHKYTTNCYAYALGLDVPEYKICYHAYQPGVMSGNQKVDYDSFSYDDLIANIYTDFETLGIEVHKIYPLQEVNKDMWKISLFIPEKDPDNLDDFHFLKCLPDNTWNHKYGYNGQIINFDDNDRTITNPEECYLEDLKYDKTFGLRLKK